MLKDADIKEWTNTEYSFVKEDVKVSMHNGDSVIQISSLYQTPDKSKFTRVLTDTLIKGRSQEQELQHIINANKNAVFVNKILNKPTLIKFIFLVWIMIIFVTMAYGPIAAFLVELFPTKIRYTSMSLPYHIGNGVFGGLVPFIATLLSTTFTKDPLVGLWYPIGVAALCFIIGALYLSNKIDKDVND